MKLDRTGIILYTIKYEDCVRFYQNILGFKVMFKTYNLTCFEFGPSYLMVEREDENLQLELEHSRHKTCLRLNVSNVEQMAQYIQEKGVSVDLQVHDWGTVAKFTDPDGNLCAFKDSEKFENQVLNLKK